MSEEEKRVLKMVEDGRISAEEAIQLMKALGEAASENRVEVIDAPASSGSARSEMPELESVKKRALRFAAIPLWAGIVIAVLSAWGIYAILQSAGMNFWFFCLLFPFLLGVLLIALGAGGSNGRWLYVNVEKPEGEGPKHITLAFPLSIVSAFVWILRNFSGMIHGINGSDREKINAALGIMDALNSSDPIIVNVDEGDGERVQVFIG